jgi:hypothetical protein
MTITGLFRIEHNIREAIRQEYYLARQHYDDVCGRLDHTSPDSTERYRDAAERLSQARELNLKRSGF